MNWPYANEIWSWFGWFWYALSGIYFISRTIFCIERNTWRVIYFYFHLCWLVWGDTVLSSCSITILHFHRRQNCFLIFVSFLKGSVLLQKPPAPLISNIFQLPSNTLFLLPFNFTFFQRVFLLLGLLPAVYGEALEVNKGMPFNQGGIKSNVMVSFLLDIEGTVTKVGTTYPNGLVNDPASSSRSTMHIQHYEVASSVRDVGLFRIGLLLLFDVSQDVVSLSWCSRRVQYIMNVHHQSIGHCMQVDSSRYNLVKCIQCRSCAP